jgi:hypothetical protein
LKIEESELEYKKGDTRISCTPDWESNSILITGDTKNSIDFISIQTEDAYTFLACFMRALSINTALTEMYARDAENSY